MSPTPKAAARRGEAAAGRALRHEWVERAAQFGLISRAINYSVLGVLVALVLLGSTDQEVDRRGAVQTLSSTFLGRALLIVLCAGFVAYIVWQLLRAAAHRRDQGDAANAWRRLLALGTAVLYAGFLFSTARVLLGSSTESPQQSQDSWTARVMNASGGRALLFGVGCVLIIIGLSIFGWALTRTFLDALKLRGLSRRLRRALTVLGVVGQASRGVVFAIIGGFVVSAGAAGDASRSKGLDASLKTLAVQRFGAVMLGVVALGFLAFGLYSLVEAKYRNDFSR